MNDKTLDILDVAPVIVLDELGNPVNGTVLEAGEVLGYIQDGEYKEADASITGDQ